MPGYMYSDLCDLVFNVMHYIIEFQKHIYLDDPVVKVLSFCNFRLTYSINLCLHQSELFECLHS